jgi:hydroxymethylpyrimidine pyrophosphatase-like HAD family hydrolase
MYNYILTDTMKTEQKIYQVQYKKDEKNYIYNTLKTFYFEYMFYSNDLKYSYGAFRSIVFGEQYDKLELFKITKHNAKEYLQDHYEKYKIYNKCNYTTNRAETMVYNKLFRIATMNQRVVC